MKIHRGRRAALWAGTVAVLFLLLAGLAFKDAILEAYYLRLLETGDAGERKIAARKLGWLASVRAVPLLLRPGDDGTWHDRMHGLARIYLQKPGEIFPVLVSVLKSEDAKVREFTLEVLTEPILHAYLVRKGRTEEPQLKTLVPSEGGLFSAVYESSRDQLLPIVGAALKDEVKGVRELAAAALGYAGKEGVPFLYAALKDEDVEIRRNAVHAFHWSQDEARYCAPLLIEALQDKDAEVRSLAAGSLHAIGVDPSLAVPALQQLLAVEKEPEVQESALSALSSMGPAGVPALLSALKHEEVDMRYHAAYWFAWNRMVEHAKTVMPFFLEMMAKHVKSGKDDPGRQYVRMAIRGFGEMGPEGAPGIPHLVELLGGGDKMIREEAAWALGKIGEKAGAAVPALLGLLGDAEGSTRKVAINALGSIDRGTPEVLSALAALVSDQDADDDVRGEAQEALKLIKERQAAASNSEKENSP